MLCFRLTLRLCASMNFAAISRCYRGVPLGRFDFVALTRLNPGLVPTSPTLKKRLCNMTLTRNDSSVCLLKGYGYRKNVEVNRVAIGLFDN